MCLSSKESICNAGDAGDSSLIPGSGRSLEKEMATHSSKLSGKLTRMQGLGGLQSIMSQKVGHH